jgi:hypothetical protein
MCNTCLLTEAIDWIILSFPLPDLPQIPTSMIHPQDSAVCLLENAECLMAEY